MTATVSVIRDFTAYFRAAADLPPHPLLLQGLAHVSGPGLALDLGAGDGKATVLLRERGYRVLALEPDPLGQGLFRRRLADDRGHVLAPLRYQEFLPPPHDVAVAIHSLYFAPREDILAFWARMTRALRPGGWFVGQLLGERDSWVEEGCAGFLRSEVEALLASYRIEVFQEEEKDSVTLEGDLKHWHLFPVIAQRVY